jgi:predicted TIM-barrel fold metal-dependent hydrolase
MHDGMVVVDAHAHIEIGGHDFYGRSTELTTAMQVERMDRYGIDAAWVIAHAWGGWTIDQYRREHELIAREISRHPDRLIGCCWADPHLGNAAVAEVRRCLTELGYRGLKLHPVYQRFLFDAPIVYPLIEVAAEFGVPVTAHLDLRTAGAEPWRMVTLAKRFPAVTFILAHMGRDIEAIADLSFARAAARVSNMIIESSNSTTDSYGTFMGPAEVLGPERVLYASDAGALHHPAVNLLKLDLLEMPRAWKELILGGNILRILGLTAADIGRAPDRPRGEYLTPSGPVRYAYPAALGHAAAVKSA